MIIIYSKVLLISNNPFSEVANNGKTYQSLFEGWPKKNIAQLYFSAEQPSYKVCDTYYNFKKNISHELSKNQEGKIQNGSSSSKFFNKVKKLPLAGTIFNEYWKILIEINKKEMDSFIRDFNPDVIFFVGGRLQYTYKTVNYISRRYNIPAYVFYTDDYFEVEKNDIFSNVNNYLFKKEAQKTITNSPKLFVISEKMKEEYTKLFSKECIPVMNCINFNEYENYSYSQPKQNLKFAYFGGLHLNRLESILKIAREIDKINIKADTNHQLVIYSFDVPNGEQKDKIDKVQSLNYKGKVEADEIKTYMSRYDVLVFVESFEESMIKRTRLSLSTKIPEYLAMGKPIFGVGPLDSGSISYLKDLSFTYIVDKNNKELINNELNLLIDESSRFERIYEKSRELAENNFSCTQVHQVIRKELTNE